MSYKHITLEERHIIQILFYVLNFSITKIANTLNKSNSTISRELKRNLNELGMYVAKTAHKKATLRFKNCHLMKFLKYKEFTKDFVANCDKRYSGVKTTYQILKPKEYKHRPSDRQIYNWIKSGRWNLTWNDRLRKFIKKGGKRTIGIFGDFKNKYIMPYWTRPNYINNREEFGHWELDLVIGIGNKNNYDHVLTFLERKTRMYFAIKVNSKLSHHINGKLYQLIKEKNLCVRSITTDNGIEFENLGIVAKLLNIKVYKCEPYASHRKCSNENTNGLLRRFYKKGTNFNLITNEEIQNSIDLINTMPREIFNWKSSYELYVEEMKKSRIRDQLILLQTT